MIYSRGMDVLFYLSIMSCFCSLYLGGSFAQNSFFDSLPKELRKHIEVSLDKTNRISFSNVPVEYYNVGSIAPTGTAFPTQQIMPAVYPMTSPTPYAYTQGTVSTTPNPRECKRCCEDDGMQQQVTMGVCATCCDNHIPLVYSKQALKTFAGFG
ncbi:hypothetical protein ACFFRR_006037 [Megaselia abdita]